MSVNVGSIDRVIRFLIGIALVALPLVSVFTSTLWTTVSIVVGLVMLGVAATRVCPVYLVLGIRTTAS